MLARGCLGALVMFATAYGSIDLTRNAQHVSTFWLANAFLLAILLKQPARFWPAYLAGGLLGNSSAHLLVADPLPLVVGLPVLNVVEVLCLAAALRSWKGRNLDLSRLPHLGAFVLLAGVVAPAATSVASVVLFARFRHVPPATLWAIWYSVNALGFLVFTPLLLMAGPVEARALLRPGHRLEALAWCTALAAVTAVTFTQNTYPLLFLPMAVLALVSVRLGPASTAVGIGFVAVSAALATLHGLGPMMLTSGDPMVRGFVLQGFVASVALSNLPLTAFLSDLRRAERAAVESEARYRLLADNASDMITHMDLKGRRLFVSPGARDLLGFEPDELIGTSRAAYVHPDDEPSLRPKLEALAAGAVEQVVNVNRVRHRAGHWVWVEASVRLLRDEGGRPSGMVAALRDVTARKLADEALRQSEERYRLLADNSTDLIALKSTYVGPRPYVSPSVHAMTGYTPEEFATLAPSDYVHPEDQALVAAQFAGLTPDRPEVRSLHRVRHKAGRWMWVESDFRLVDAGEGPRTVLVRSRDVTLRQESQQALAASEARYRVLAETTSDVITQLGMDLRRQYVSPSCRRVLGYEPQEMLDVQPSTRMHPEDGHGVRALALRLAAGEVEGDRATVTYRSLHKEGRWVWLETVMTLVRHEATGAPTSLICSLRDVTERRRAAENLERAKLEAEAAARAKADFVANMSHELRTPLTGIIGVHDLLRADPGLTAAQRRLADLAGEAGRSLLAIVNDVLDFSKVDAGQLALETVPFDLDDLIASCCGLAHEQLKTKPVTLSVVREPGLPRRYAGDPTRLRQILLNLLTNAVKFTERGRIALHVAYGSETGTLRVRVADTGIGIPPDRIGALFERFTQADTSMTRRYGGTGLGLAICKRLIDLMGGRIGAEAAVGGGSVFWFELPLACHEGRFARIADAVPGVSETVERTLLLAEDNRVNAEVIAAMLATRGYRVSVVSDGAAAVEAVRTPGGFDLILMDLQMPVMDGLAASRAIRADEAARGVARRPIVGLTANAMPEDATLCLEAGMDAHVAKPVDWRELFALLERFLSSADRRDLADVDPADLTGVFEPGRIEELVGLLGRDRLQVMMARFVDELRTRIETVLSGGEAELSEAVHVLASTAGQFGFRELGTLCAEANTRLRTGAGFDRIDDLRSAVDRAAAAAARSGYLDVAA